ncbi:MAG: class I SAM-dependent methyltransferase [Bacteroidota bacterium]|nr:class I SAM-dependent methyltransferase [Bacteroidota bacterium]MDP4254771.1 class I SAM-dependent methyltransferase [Bacteroidota bacterium]
MDFEKEYYEFDRFWNNYAYSYEINIEKIDITFDFIGQRPIANLLDAACGNGIFTNMVAEKFREIKVVGFDRSEMALKYVNTEKMLAEIDAIPFGDASFDCVVAHDVIEHLPVGVYQKALNEIARVSRKYIVIAVPYRENLRHNVSECPSCLSHFNNDFHFRSFDEEKMKGLFGGTGFECKDIRTCNTNRFYVGQKTYGRLFYPKWQKKLRSPICPVCGYLNPEDSGHESSNPVLPAGNETDAPGTAHATAPAPASAATSLLGMIKKIPKAIWPKYSKDYEMVAFFEKKSNV